MKKYFLHNGNQQEGPFSFEELKTKGITKDTPIWFEGQQDWQKAQNIEELKELWKTASPPPFSKPSPPSYKVTEEPVKQSKSRRTKDMLLGTAVVLGLIFIAALVFSQFNRSSGGGSTYEEKVMTVEEIERAEPTRFLKASGTYSENFWGDKFKVTCEITNDATVVSYKDAVIRIMYYSKTQTLLGTDDHTVYEAFPPTSTKTVEFKVKNYKDVKSLGWEVVSALPN